MQARLSTSNGYYDSDFDRIGIFSDGGTVALPLRASDHVPLPVRPITTLPNDVRYDPARHEGLVCNGSGLPLPIGGLAALFTPEPFTYRTVGVSPLAVASLGSGCDWDVDTGLIYVTVPALGLLATIHRDTGELDAVRFIGLGMRAITVDSARQLVYVGDFFRGEVRALDAKTGIEKAHWFVGRYVHDLRLTKDRRDLLATSTLGVLRIHLGEVNASR
jgi:hypothetical protein